jgi:predicted nucleotidyltransferase
MTTPANTKVGLNPVRKRAIEQLRGIVLTALEDVPAEVWLFGSCARGDLRRHSDIDIGILPGAAVPTSFFGFLIAVIEESAIPFDVDLVDLRDADPSLLKEIRREGIVWKS